MISKAVVKFLKHLSSLSLKIDKKLKREFKFDLLDIVHHESFKCGFIDLVQRDFLGSF